MKTLSVERHKVTAWKAGPTNSTFTMQLSLTGQSEESSHGILLKSSRIVVPSTMTLQVLDKVDEGHQGKVKCRELCAKY